MRREFQGLLCLVAPRVIDVNCGVASASILPLSQGWPDHGRSPSAKAINRRSSRTPPTFLTLKSRASRCVSGNAGGPIMPPQLVTFLPIRAPGPDPCRLPRICSCLRVFSSFLGAASNVENEPGLRAFRRKNFSSFCAYLAQICYIENPDRLTKDWARSDTAPSRSVFSKRGSGRREHRPTSTNERSGMELQGK